MKRILSIIAIGSAVAILMVSCKSKQQDVVQNVSYEDTVGFAKFQEWKTMNERAEAAQYAPAVASAPVKTVRTVNTPAKTGTMSSTTTNQAKVEEKKKGWSKSAKYAVIGGVVGGTTGAVINKKDRVKGAVIGVVLGTGAGYGIGRSQDKKDGRIDLNK